MPKRLITLTALLVVALSTPGYAQTRTEHFAECRTQHPERFARSRLLTEATLTDPDFARIERRLKRLAQRAEDCTAAWDEKVAAARAKAARQSSLAPSPPPLGAQGSGSGSITANAALGQSMAAARGWVGVQWDALNALVMAESAWSTTALNPTSGACGIPQALPCTIWGWSAAAQIEWMLDYIAAQYGSPLAARSFQIAHGYY